MILGLNPNEPHNIVKTLLSKSSSLLLKHKENYYIIHLYFSSPC